MTGPMINHDRLKQRRAGSRAGTGWKPKDGENVVRVLPPHSRFLTAWDQLDDVAIAYKMHFFRIEGRPTEVSRCLEELKPKQRCPACDAWRAYRKSEDPALAEMAKDIGPADNYLMNILDVNNMEAGVQAWGANYTCWDKILEIVANPKWGNVLDPADGVNFVITKTPAAKSRTGWPQYSVMPEPDHTTIMEFLEKFQDWQETLDGLEAQITAAKEPDEIQALLTEMGFPAPAVPRAASPAPRPVGATPRPVGAAPRAAVPAAVGPRPVAPAARPGVKPVQAAAPRPVGTAPRVAAAVKAAPRVAAKAAAPVPEEATETTEPHYDPGPDYQPVTPDEERPAGAPRCFGDYQPEVHACEACPLLAECQMKMLEVV
jgi:gp32-like DNA binding protein